MDVKSAIEIITTKVELQTFSVEQACDVGSTSYIGLIMMHKISKRTSDCRPARQY